MHLIYTKLKPVLILYNYILQDSDFDPSDCDTENSVVDFEPSKDANSNKKRKKFMKFEVLKSYTSEQLMNLAAVINYFFGSNKSSSNTLVNYFKNIKGVSETQIKRFSHIFRFVNNGALLSLQQATPNGTMVDRNICNERIKVIADSILGKLKKIRSGLKVFDDETINDFNNFDAEVYKWSKTCNLNIQDRSRKPKSKAELPELHPQTSISQNYKREALKKYSEDQMKEAAAFFNLMRAKLKKLNEPAFLELANYFKNALDEGKSKNNTLVRVRNIVRFIPSYGIDLSVQKYTPDGKFIDRKASSEAITTWVTKVLSILVSIRKDSSCLPEKAKEAFFKFNNSIDFWSKAIDCYDVSHPSNTDKSLGTSSSLNCNGIIQKKKPQDQCPLPTKYQLEKAKKTSLLEAVKANIVTVFHWFFKYKCNMNLLAQFLQLHVKEKIKNEKLCEVINHYSDSFLEKYCRSINENFSKLDSSFKCVLVDIIKSIQKNNWFFTVDEIVADCNKVIGVNNANGIPPDSVFQKLLPILTSTSMFLNSFEGVERMIKNIKSFHSQLRKNDNVRTTFMHQTELVFPDNIKKLVSVKFWFGYSLETRKIISFALIVDESSKLKKESCGAWIKLESGLQYKIDFPHREQAKNEIEMVTKIMDEDKDVRHLVIVDRIDPIMETFFLRETQKKGNLVLRLPKCNPEMEPSNQINFGRLFQRIVSRHFFNHFKEHGTSIKEIKGEDFVEAIECGTISLNNVLTEDVLEEMYKDTGLNPIDLDRIFDADIGELDEKYRKLLKNDGDIINMYLGTALWKNDIKPQKIKSTAAIDNKNENENPKSLNKTPRIPNKNIKGPKKSEGKNEQSIAKPTIKCINWKVPLQQQQKKSDDVSDFAVS